MASLLIGLYALFGLIWRKLGIDGATASPIGPEPICPWQKAGRLDREQVRLMRRKGLDCVVPLGAVPAERDLLVAA